MAGANCCMAVDDLQVEIDLRVEIDPSEASCHLMGQVLPLGNSAALPPVSAVVEAADGRRTPGDLHPTGEITASYPRTGTCTLLLGLGGVQLTLPLLEP